VADLRNVIVTGASRGLGLAIAGRLAADGYRVLAVARTRSDELDALGGDVRFAAVDLGDLDRIPDLVNRLRDAHGPIYGLVNNAGLGTEGMLATMSLADMERLVRLNTLAPMVVAKQAVRSMMSAGGGRIVNMSSIIASTGYSGLSCYAATKASMIGFTKSLAREVGPLGITANAVAPGFVATDMTAGMDEKQRAAVARRAALKRLPEAADVAAAVAYLIGEAGRNVTGTVLTIDAGNTA
jgi:3-oxoacyl-[acyl-carrier protein] reductase